MVSDALPSAATGAERFAWSIYDFASSGYTTVVLTMVKKGDRFIFQKKRYIIWSYNGVV